MADWRVASSVIDSDEQADEIAAFDDDNRPANESERTPDTFSTRYRLVVR